MKTYSVLVVDDSLTIRKLAERVLKEQGYRVELAESMSQALQKVARYVPDLILLDYVLPDGQGTDVCRSLLTEPRFASVPVLLISAKGSDIRQIYTDLPNVVDFLTKPFTPAVLASVVGHLLQKAQKQDASRRDTQPLMVPLENLPLGPEDRPPTVVALENVLLSGRFSLLPLLDVLAAVEREGASGMLRVTVGDARVTQIVLDAGRVTYALPYRTYLQVGALAPALSHIPPGALKHAVASHVPGTRTALAVLADEGYIGSATTAKLQKIVALTAILETVQDKDGSFVLESSRDIPEEARRFPFDLSVDEIRMGQLRRVDDWHVIEKQIPSLELVLIQNRQASRLSARLHLEPKEMAVLGLVDGQTTVRDIVQRSDSTTYEVCQILYRLITADLVRHKVMRGGPVEELNRLLVVDAEGEEYFSRLTDLFAQRESPVEVRCVDRAFERIPYQFKVFQPDALLIETELTAFDARKLIKQIRQSAEFETTRVVAMAADLDKDEVEQLMRIGVNAFLAKPFLPEQLLEAFGLEPELAYAQQVEV